MTNEEERRAAVRRRRTNTSSGLLIYHNLSIENETWKKPNAIKHKPFAAISIL